MKILIVEDEALIAENLGEFLFENGHSYIKSYDILEAEEILNRENIDFLICDLNMPPIGLEDELQSLTQTGALTGYIWFEKYIKIHHPNLVPKTLFFSAYLEYLEFIPADEIDKDLIKIPKGNFDSNKFEAILKLINKKS